MNPYAFLLCAAYEHIKYLVSILQCLDKQNTLVLISIKEIIAKSRLDLSQDIPRFLGGCIAKTRA